uniref:COMM domain-containing protein n=1 Tax=Caenorhabditis tropicalis TaxID=1561998 RepID=A0A1I7U7U2_9PELO
MEPVLPQWDESQTIIKSKLTNRASIRILERYPLTDDDVETLFKAEEMAGGDPEALFQLCRLLIKVWKYAIFFQPKPDAFIELMQENSYPGPVIKGILEAYSSETMAEVVETLASCSNSGIPRVMSTDWTSRTVVRRDNLTSTDREAVLTFSTDQGVKKVQLNARDLERLYWTVNKVQASLDGLLER